VKLLDFGVAHARTGIAGAERSGTIKGKLGYLAPEQCVGGPVDARTDVFALGVCLWEGLTGKRLFRRDDDAESLRAIVQEEAPEPSSTGVDVPIRLSAIVLRALERDPKKRFASAAELQDALEQYLIDERERVGSARLARYVYDLFGDRVSAPPLLDRSPEVVGWMASGAPRSRKRTRAWILAGAGLLTAAIVVGIAAGQWSAEPEQRAAPAQPNAQVAAWSAPPTSAPPSLGAPAATAEPPIEPAVAGEATPAPGETQRPVRHRRRPVPGGFVQDPGF
jgi:serine/threonine-protein kinase